MKRLAKLILALGLAVVVIGFVAPYFVSVDRFKPELQAAVKKGTGLTLDFESARLTILSGVGFQVKNASLSFDEGPYRGVKLLLAPELHLRAALLPLLTRHFVLTLVADRPDLTLPHFGWKNTLGSATRRTAPPAPSGATPPTAASAVPPAPWTWEDLKSRVLVRTLRLVKAQIHIKDLEAGAGEPIDLSDINLKIDDIGINEDIRAEVSTTLAVRRGENQWTGPFKAKAAAKVIWPADHLERVDFKGDADLTAVSIDVDGYFVKRPGIPFTIHLAGKASDASVDLDPLEIKLHSLLVKGQGSLGPSPALALDASLAIEQGKLATLADLFPQHAVALGQGQIDARWQVHGPLSALDSLGLQGDARLTLADAQWLVDAKLKGVLPPAGQITFGGKNVDLDAVMRPFRTGAVKVGAPVSYEAQTKSTPSEPPSASSTPAPSAATPAAPDTPAAGSLAEAAPKKDFSLSPAQKTILAGSDLAIAGTIDGLSYGGIQAERFELQSRQRDLIHEIKALQVKVLGGSLTASGLIDLAPDPLSFEGRLEAKNLDIGRLVNAVGPAPTRIVTGHCDVEVKGFARGSTAPSILASLDASGQTSFTDGALDTANVSKALGEQVDRMLSEVALDPAIDASFKAAEQLVNTPLVKAVSPDATEKLKKYRDDYEKVKKIKVSEYLPKEATLKGLTGTFSVRQGQLRLTTHQVREEGTFDFVGDIGLQDLGLSGQTHFVASQQTQDRLLAESKYAALLWDDKGQLALTAGLSGRVDAPKVAFDPAPLRERVLKNARQMADKDMQGEAQALIGGLLGKNKDKEKDNDEKKNQDGKKEPEDQLQKEIKKGKDLLNKLFGK